MYKVLIIDDVSLVQDAVKLLGQWEAFGITSIFEACNAQEGLDIIYRERPELIITDMKMPIMDGTALLKKLEEKPIRSKIIVSAVSATSNTPGLPSSPGWLTIS